MRIWYRASISSSRRFSSSSAVGSSTTTSMPSRSPSRPRTCSSSDGFWRYAGSVIIDRTLVFRATVAAAASLCRLCSSVRAASKSVFASRMRLRRVEPVSVALLSPSGRAYLAAGQSSPACHRDREQQGEGTAYLGLRLRDRNIRITMKTTTRTMKAMTAPAMACRKAPH